MSARHIDIKKQYRHLNISIQYTGKFRYQHITNFLNFKPAYFKYKYRKTLGLSEKI